MIDAFWDFSRMDEHALAIPEPLGGHVVLDLASLELLCLAGPGGIDYELGWSTFDDPRLTAPPTSP